MTPAQREAYARANSSLLHLVAIEFLHSTFEQPLRIVDFDKDLILPLELDAPVNPGEYRRFTGWDVDVKPPDIDDEVDAVATMQIDGVSGLVQALLVNASKSIEPIKANIRFYSYNVSTEIVDGPVGTIYQNVRSIAISSASVAVTTGYSNSANKAFPAQIYTSYSNPGLVS